MQENYSGSVQLNDVSSSEDVLTAFLLSDEITIILHWLLFAVLCQAIDIFGVGSNVINIICFIKQGFIDPVNVSLLGLAVSDLGCLITLIWTNLCYTPAFRAADLPFDSIEFQYLTTGFLHISFSRITSWITALITFERCLCIATPLKVKSIITSKRMSIIIACFYIINLMSMTPVYVVNRLGMKFFPQRNKTLIGLVYTASRVNMEPIIFSINNVVLPFLSFIIIIICTITLIHILNTKRRWRKQLLTTKQVLSASNRDHKVAKMVTIIAVLFITCYLPLCIMFIVMSAEPRISVHGKYLNMLTILGNICLVLESINSSTNIFIYYYMSSKYKTVFITLFSHYN